MAFTLSDFLRTWRVTDTHDLLAAYVNTDKTITFQMGTPPDSLVCTTQTGYSKNSSINWAAAHYTATVDPGSPPNIMLRSRATDPSEGGIDGNNVYFRILAEPGGGAGLIRCNMATLATGTWNGSED